MKATIRFNDNHELRALKLLSTIHEETLLQQIKSEKATGKFQIKHWRNFLVSHQLIRYTLEDLLGRLEQLELRRSWNGKRGKGSIQVTRAEVQALFMHFQIRNFQEYEQGVYHKTILPLLTIVL